ncbi:MAG TPA: hypothetical protein VFM00_04160 [Candidatus Eisenbacteria bacterium]|nr:hypothetical protein [Candidatus Eisenbacteria bacterium]
MHEYVLTHLSDAILLRDLKALVRQDRATTVMLLAHIAEVDSRRLYAPAGYSSMFAYCTEELGLSEDAAYKRIRAARAARRFPVLFKEMAEGRLHMAAVCVLSPHLTSENLEELTQAASHRRKSEVEEWLIHRFPGAVSASRECVTSIRPLDVSRMLTGSMDQLVLGPVPADPQATPHPETPSLPSNEQLVPGPVVGGPRNERDGAPSPKDLIEAPLPDLASRASEMERLPKRYLVRLTIDEATHEKLRRAQAMLSHAVPGGDVAEVLGRALDALIRQLETRKIGSPSGGKVKTREAEPPREASPKPRSSNGAGAAGSRYIPARVRRAVWERDQGRCTFVTHAGHRCSARRLLEFDHIEPVARGGRSTVDGLRLRCRAHNQYAAERAFGAEFMRQKREARREQSVRREASKSQPNMVREPSCSWQVLAPGRVGVRRDVTIAGLMQTELAPGRVGVAPRPRCASAAHEHVLEDVDRAR